AMRRPDIGCVRTVLVIGALLGGGGVAAAIPAQARGPDDFLDHSIASASATATISTTQTWWGSATLSAGGFTVAKRRARSPKWSSPTPVPVAVRNSPANRRKPRWALPYPTYARPQHRQWDSRDDDAIIYDRERGVFADPSKVREIGFLADLFRSRGRHFVAPSPQRRPVLWQAGSSQPGREFASKQAESVFGIFPTPKSMRTLSVFRIQLADKLAHESVYYQDNSSSL
ncbi:MAG: long-chain alkane monooxygenase, partial [Mycobacterium sp.]|nr:long-chain alkane monooxygenase [Mycobacterium sp.]